MHSNPISRRHSVLSRLAAVLAITIGLVPNVQATLLSFTAALDGTQAGSGSLATGFATVSFDTLAGEIDIDLGVEGIALSDLRNVGPNASPVHIHNAPIGSNGPIVFDLGFFSPFVADGNGIGSTIDDHVYQEIQGALSSSLSIAEFEQALRDGNTYLNIHTNAFPGGEIRGQLQAQVPSPATAGLLVLGLIGLGAYRHARLS